MKEKERQRQKKLIPPSYSERQLQYNFSITPPRPSRYRYTASPLRQKQSYVFMQLVG